MGSPDLNSHYQKLAFELNDGDKGHFLSGWQCDNPFIDELLAAVRSLTASIDYRRYAYFDDDEGLVDAIKDLHKGLDSRAPEQVLCGSGATALLFAFATYLRRRNVTSVYYVPPMYFTLHAALDRYGIKAIPVSAAQPYEPSFSLDLPTEQGAVLILTDPIWYAGKSVPLDAIVEIAAWQERTESVIFVDGSLQYMSWNGGACEHTALLDPAATFRLVCPSKQLSIHGYRFAYVLGPSLSNDDLAWTYANINGPASADSIAFAHLAIPAIARGDIRRQTAAFVSERHQRLRERKIIESTIAPDCGYFVFEKVNAPLPPQYTIVDGRYFEQANYPGYMKVNLLSPSINLIEGNR